MIWNNENLVKTLKEGGVAVMPTDTLCGIVGQAENPATVERIYKIRKRSPEKPCIILIGKLDDLEKFSVNLSEEEKIALETYWPKVQEGGMLNPVSIVLDCIDERFSYLHRGTQTLAFRLPLNLDLQNLLKKTGPLIAPSANPEDLEPAKNTTEAKNYFGESVDLYIDGGEVTSKASKIIKLQKDGSIDILRE